MKITVYVLETRKPGYSDDPEPIEWSCLFINEADRDEAMWDFIAEKTGSSPETIAELKARYAGDPHIAWAAHSGDGWRMFGWQQVLDVHVLAGPEHERDGAGC